MTADRATRVDRGVRRAFRTQIWWSAKVLPAIAAALLAAITAETAPGRGRWLLVALVVSAAGIASASHLINDWSDIEADALAAKGNAVGQMRTASRIVLLVAAATVGIVPWVVVRPAPVVVALLAALFVLPIVYSVPPTRLKGRGAAGVVADAADAHVVPTALAFAVMVEAGAPTTSWTIGLVAASIWSGGLGVRAILHHQVLDLGGDRAGGVRTFVAQRGPEAAQRIGRVAFVVELAGLAGLALALATSVPWVLVPFALFAALWWADQRWEARDLEPLPGPGNDWMPLVEFYQVWPAVIFSITLVLIDLAWWPVPVVIAALFGGAIAKQASDLGRMARAAGHDLRSGAVRASWWLRRRPLRWLRLQVYWPLHDRLVSVGHFRRRQARRIRRHARRLRGSGRDRRV